MLKAFFQQVCFWVIL